MGKPTIRFEGYTDDWEQRKLDDVVEFLDTMRKPLEGAKRISGPYPYYGASGIVDYVDGYLFDEELILLSEDGANITDRNYPVCFLASGKYWVNNHAHVLRTKQGNENNFICNSLERKDYTQYNTGMAMPKLNKETCKKIPILCPGFEEQKKIGDYFRSLDNLITLHHRKYINGKKEELLAWEQRKLDDVVEFLDTMRKPLEGAKRISGPYPYYGASGIVDYVDGYLFDEELILLSEDGANITDRNYPVCFLASGKYWVNNHAHVLRTKQGNENNFICNSLERKDYTQYNTGMAMPKLNKETCKKIPILCPGFEEQKKIGDYFRSLDNLITLHQRKCEETKKLKKFMLQKMFPKKGEKVPEIRFGSFTDDWEQRKLNEIADKVSEKNKNNEFSEPFTNSAEQGIISQKDYFDREIVNNENLNGYYIVRNDDFIYNPRISATAPVGPINRNRLGRNGVMSPLYTVFRTHDIDNLYLEFYFKSTKWHRFMKLNGDSGARFDRFTISSTQFMEMPIPYPTLEEQQKIGEYFESLDTLITLHQHKCEELQNIKKFMLQNMFI